MHVIGIILLFVLCVLLVLNCACLVRNFLKMRATKTRAEHAWKMPHKKPVFLKPGLGCFKTCGSYYPKVTCADELWDYDYVAACKELDSAFPAARLLPKGSWSLGVSEKLKRAIMRRGEQS